MFGVFDDVVVGGKHLVRPAAGVRVGLGAGQAIVTPKIVKAELVAQYREDEFNGLVENATAFKANLIVERDPIFAKKLEEYWGKPKALFEAPLEDEK